MSFDDFFRLGRVVRDSSGAGAVCEDRRGGDHHDGERGGGPPPATKEADGDDGIVVEGGETGEEREPEQCGWDWSGFSLAICGGDVNNTSVNELPSSCVAEREGAKEAGPSQREQKRSSKGAKTNKFSSSSSRKVPTTHIRLFGHGKVWTMVGLTVAWIGCILAAFSRRSTQFVTLDDPVEVAPVYRPVHETGLIRMNLCYNETVSGESGCEVITLSPEEIDDTMFELSRSFLTLATFAGFFLTVVLSTTVYWESINLRPVGVGFLVTYFFQSFALLFFDSDLCGEHGCNLAAGSVLCIVASVCWIAATICAAKMDAFKIRALRRRRKAARRARREERRRRRTELLLAKQQSTATNATDSTASSGEGKCSPSRT
jgi:hypothetical protein